MTRKPNRRATLSLMAATVASPLLIPGLAHAQTVHDVEMLNTHPEDRRQRMVFYSRVLVIEPGDTVNFLATDRGHNTATLEEMIPDGAEGWNGRINEEVSVTLDLPGYYGYECVPHASLGMVGLIIVNGDGRDGNLEAAQGVSHRGRAQAAWDEIWEEVAGLSL